MPRISLRLLADAMVVAIALFASAGTLMWWRAWALLAVLFVVRFLGARAVFRVNPALLLERATAPIHQGQPLLDKVLVFAVLATGFVGLPIVAGLDRLRWHQFLPPPATLAALGLVLYGSGWAIKSLALRENAFAVAVVRIQREHVVVDSGIYSILRHPFYAADPLIFVGLGLWLGSYMAVLCAVVPIGILLLRIRMEEEFLQRELPGYSEYTKRVPHRLMPGIW